MSLGLRGHMISIGKNHRRAETPRRSVRRIEPAPPFVLARRLPPPHLPPGQLGTTHRSFRRGRRSTACNDSACGSASSRACHGTMPDTARQLVPARAMARRVRLRDERVAGRAPRQWRPPRPATRTPESARRPRPGWRWLAEDLVIGRLSAPQVIIIHCGRSSWMSE